MKKLLLGIGTLAAVAAPVTAIVACSSDKNSNNSVKPSLIIPIIASQVHNAHEHHEIQPWIKEFDFQDYAGHNYKIRSRADIDKLEFRVTGSLNVNNDYFFTNFKFMNEVWKTEADAMAYVKFVKNFIISYWEDDSNFAKGIKVINHSLTNLLMPFWGKGINTDGVI